MTDSHDDADIAARSLMANPESHSAYDLMYAIGKAEAIEHRALIESHLDDRADPMRARLALQILCNWWGLADEYRHEIFRFTKGVDWDLSDGGFVQLVAISAAGELLRSRDDSALLTELVSLYDSGASDLVKGAAYSASMARYGLGRNTACPSS